MSKKNLMIIVITFCVMFLGLAITFFFMDLNISIALATNNYKNPNLFLKTLEAVGEFPIYIGPMLFALVYGLTNKTKLWKLIANFVGLIVTYVAGVRLVGGIFESFYNSELSSFQSALLAISSLLIYVLLFLLFTRFKQENLVKLRDISLIMMLVSAFSFVSVTGIKYIMGRARFRILDENYSEFSNFLTMNFFRGLDGDGYRSFPSGHTGSATCLLTSFLIPMRLCNKKWVTYTVFGASFLYAIVVALSRIMIGAHYASDVLFGFGCSVISFAVVYFIFYKKGWLNARSN